MSAKPCGTVMSMIDTDGSPHAARVRARADAVKVAKNLRDEQKKSVVEIAELLGRSPSTIRNYLADPDGAKARNRKDSYRGTCEKCGAPTSGGNGKDQAKSLCVRCKGDRYRKWDKDKIVAAFVHWHATYGDLPTSADLSTTYARRRGPEHVQRLAGGTYPVPSRVSAVFGTYAAARKAAERALGQAAREQPARD